MNKQVMQTMKKAKKKGLTPLEVLHMQEIAKREALKMENEAIEKAFLYMLAIPLNVLVHDYWPKTAKKKAPKLIDDIISLHESVQEGYVTDRELADVLKEYAGHTVNELWLQKIERKKGGWIPCSERLPDSGTEVLVTLGYTYESDYTMYSIARHIKFEDGECHWCDNRYGYLEWDKYSDGRGGNSSYRVIAWMPLPELYTEQT